MKLFIHILFYILNSICIGLLIGRLIWHSFNGWIVGMIIAELWFMAWDIYDQLHKSQS